MVVLALDPGTTETAFVLWDGVQILSKGIVPNASILEIIYGERPIALRRANACFIEKMEGYNMAVGNETFTTIYWYGRFAEAWWANQDADEATMIGRKAVKIHHCGNARATDADIRAALIDRFGIPGNKKTPGMLYSVTKHEWSALAIAVYATDTQLAVKA